MSAAYIIRRSEGRFRWNLFASNNETILSSEHYVAKDGARGGIVSCRVHSPHDHFYSRLTSTANQPYFVLKASNGEVIGVSEMYSSSQAREVGIASCKLNGPTAPEVDQS